MPHKAGTATLIASLKPASRAPEEATSVAAILCMVAVYICFTFLDTSGKYLVLAGFAPLFLSFVRFSVHVLIVLVLRRGWRDLRRFRPKSLPLHVLRGLFLFGSTIFNFMALGTLQLAETTSIYFFGPMVITALAGPLLGEWAGWRRWLAILAGFVGVLIITRPGVGVLAVGHLFALASMLSNCFYVIMTRRLASSETPESLVLFSALAPAVLLLPAVPATMSLPADAFHWFVLLSLGFYGAVGHWFVVRAYRLATTSSLAPYPYLQMVWMILAGYLVFDQLPDRWTVAGAAVIVASGLYIVHREHRLRLARSAMLGAEEAELAKKL